MSKRENPFWQNHSEDAKGFIQSDEKTGYLLKGRGEESIFFCHGLLAESFC